MLPLHINTALRECAAKKTHERVEFCQSHLSWVATGFTRPDRLEKLRGLPVIPDECGFVSVGQRMMKLTKGRVAELKSFELDALIREG
jgi:hypothetical protein